MDWLLSHPIPVLLVCCTAGIALAWNALERQRARQLAAAAGLLLAGVALAWLAWLVDTPGERAERVVLAFIERAVAADPAGAIDLLAPDACIHFGGFDQPAMQRVEIERDLASLQARHRVQSHANLHLDARTESADQVVSVGCLTETQSSPGRVLTSWSFRVRPRADGRWVIQAISFDLLAGSTPRPGIF